MNSRLLLVEDEPGLSLTVTDLLEAEGYQVDTAMDGLTGLAKAGTGEYDVVILDVMLPGKSGFDVCRELRQKGCDTAIIMLTAKTHVTDRVVGLKLGADDYLAKPFDPSELLARVESLLRRVPKKKRIPVAQFEFGNVSADFALGQVHKKGEPVTLAAKELQLLR
jgi:two-component system, OmpR family, alkaline phosphatase synthesis response regulator PhoP